MNTLNFRPMRGTMKQSFYLLSKSVRSVVLASAVSSLLTACDPSAIVASLDQASVFSVLVDWRQSARKPDELEPIWDKTVFTQETVMVINDNPILRAQGRPLEPENFFVTHSE
jgi:hypothetical protein